MFLTIFNGTTVTIVFNAIFECSRGILWQQEVRDMAHLVYLSIRYELC